jgi:hypothetical protein
MPAPYTGSGNPGPGSGIISNDYSGSSQDWQLSTAIDMMNRYMNGDQSMLDGMTGSTAPIGQPNHADFGSAANGHTATASLATQNFFKRYVQMYGTSDPSLTSQYGTQPSHSATYEEDPNSPSSLGGSFADKTAAAKALSDAQNASQEKIAAGHDAASIATANISAGASKYAADKQLAATTMQVNESWKEATLNDATRRYVAEGDWGVQKYVAQLQDTGQDRRLVMQLADNDKNRALQAQAEANHHHETMLGLVVEVAKYDAELSRQPRNWVAYASWLSNRNIIVNGLSLSMAADMVPDSSIQPSEITQATGGASVASLQLGQSQGTVSTATTTSQSAALSIQVQAVTPQPGVDQQWNGQNGTGAADTANTAQPMTPPVDTVTGAQPTTSAAGASPYSIGGVDLNSTDYGAIAQQLLGMSGAGGATTPTTADYQGMYDSLATNRSGGQGGLQGYAGPTTNSVGVQINEPMGQQADYRQFARLLPSQQDMKLGGIDSIRAGGGTDWLQEALKARPKGGAVGASSFG